MDERDRDKFYTPPDPTPDDDEYELEPLDPAIVDAEKRHAKEVAEQVRDSIDIDEVYREVERNRGTEILENWARNFQYRFHIKHLLIATAVVVIGIAVAQFNYFVPAITILVIGSIVGLYFYLNWHERQQQAEAYQKRQEMYAKRRERMLTKGGTPVDDEPLAPVEVTPPTVGSSPKAAIDMWDEPPAPESVPIHFSLRSLMVAMTVAAVSLGMIHFLGGPGPTATILGLIAFVGLVILAVGIEPPQSLILGWWFILLLYVLLTIAGSV